MNTCIYFPVAVAMPSYVYVYPYMLISISVSVAVAIKPNCMWMSVECKRELNYDTRVICAALFTHFYCALIQKSPPVDSHSNLLLLICVNILYSVFCLLPLSLDVVAVVIVIYCRYFLYNCNMNVLCGVLFGNLRSIWRSVNSNARRKSGGQINK